MSMFITFPDRCVSYDTFMDDLSARIVRNMQRAAADPETVSQRQVYAIFGRANGKRLGRPPKRKNEKFEPKKLSNGETMADLLTHVRYPLMKRPDKWTDFQKEAMRLLFEIEPKMRTAYGLLCALCNIFSGNNDRQTAKMALHKWYKDVGNIRIKEIISVRDTIKGKEEYVLNFFNNRSTNAPAESFNSKIKGLRAQVHGVNDLAFFMFRCAKIFG